MVVLSGTAVLVVLNEKHDVSRRVSGRLAIPIREIVFIVSLYAPRTFLDRWGNAKMTLRNPLSTDRAVTKRFYQWKWGRRCGMLPS